MNERLQQLKTTLEAEEKKQREDAENIKYLEIAQKIGSKRIKLMKEEIEYLEHACKQAESAVDQSGEAGKAV